MKNTERNNVFGGYVGTKEESYKTCTSCNEKVPSSAKYCPYCGTKLEDERAVFCPECGNALSDKVQQNANDDKDKNKKEKRRKPKRNKKQNDRKATRKEDNVENPETVDDGYDGYYDDVRLIDEGKFRQGIDKEMLKRVIGLLIGVLITICACVAIMYLL
jgi:uncharacterized Zn finger protein (UPF0148 family)